MELENKDNVWPLPKFYFSVVIDGEECPFQEVSGLETETQTIEYRHENSKIFSAIKMPGIAKYGNVTLKKGSFTKNNSFWSWYSQIKMNAIKRATIVINLLDEKGNATMTWTLQNAWPTKITGVEIKSDGNEVSVDSIEIAHEGISIKNIQS
jgi:phage tail-like protein